MADRPEAQARGELQRRLNRLGVTRRPASRAPQGEAAPPTPGVRLSSGTLQDSPLGPAWVIEQRFPLGLWHGSGALREVLALDPADAARVAGRPQLAETPVERWLFLDTETTGLAGGAGTLVFLVGIGGIQASEFVLRQFFLRSPVEEAGMLQALWQDLGEAPGLVTFNGGAFDLPLLETRYRLAHRRDIRLTDRAHLDLLHPSRRLWRRSLPDCSLGTLERHVLGVTRTMADVPGALIPELYLGYLRSGDPGSMEGVLYHNTQDILSLVRLAGEVIGRFTGAHPKGLSGAEALGIAGWHRAAGRREAAAAAFQIAAAADDPQVRLSAFREFSAELRRERRFEEALSFWGAWHALAPQDPQPCLELAKHYEWRVQDYGEASRWAQEALLALSHWPNDWRRSALWESIEHRLTRLARKQAR
jgi:uncharacterized protein